MNTIPNDMTRMQVQQSYTDLNQLNNIKQLGNKDQDAALKKIAEQFESMFMQMMLKSMRAANDVFAKDNPLNSFEVDFHKDNLDNQMSLSLSETGRLGLADALFRQLKGTYAPEPTITENKDTTTISNNVPERTISADPDREHPKIYQKRDQDTKALDSIRTPEDFIKAVTPYAKEIAEKMGADYKALIAQAALETGWGEHSIKDRYGNHSFNLFNIKADSRWQGHHVNVSTVEYKNGVAEKESANFRRYDSIAESFEDYQHFLQQPRYQQALEVADDSHAFIKELHQAGYATDPRYAEKVGLIMDKYFQ
jgi:flagellar protein FlgJ